VCSSGAATPATPFLFVEALAALGRPEAALSVLRARGAGPAGRETGPGGGEAAGAGGARGGPEPLAEAETALAIRLSCGLVTEGFLEVTTPRGVGEKVQGCPCQPHVSALWRNGGCHRSSSHCKHALCFPLNSGLRILKPVVMEGSDPLPVRCRVAGGNAPQGRGRTATSRPAARRRSAMGGSPLCCQWLPGAGALCCATAGRAAPG